MKSKFECVQRGQAAIEYVVICAALAIALGVGMADNTSAIRQVINTLQVAYAKFTYAMSLPG